MDRPPSLHAVLVAAQMSGGTPLYTACNCGHGSVVAVLLERGAAVNQALVCVGRLRVWGVGVGGGGGGGWGASYNVWPSRGDAGGKVRCGVMW